MVASPAIRPACVVRGMAPIRAEGPALVETSDTEALASARREIAALRERAARAEHRADGFVRMVHEIRTLLGAVTGLSTILLDGELADEPRDHVKRIRASGAALLEVVNGVLDFSKLEAGTLTVEPVEIDVRRKLEEVVALAADRAAAKGLELAACVDSDVPISVLTDGVRLRQALLNLVINAIKFTTAGSVVVRARLAEPGSFGADRALAIEVSDTGVGIHAEAVAHVFEPFRQVDASDEARSQGTGLGLSIVRGFVTAMGGKVACESRLGHGTCFTITLPLHVGRATTSLRSSRVDVAGRRLLIVDALDASRMDLLAATQALGLEASAVRTIAEAHRIVSADRVPDVIVVGVSPRDTRWVDELLELCRVARGAKIILATPMNQAVPSTVTRCLSAHLQKPARLSRLVAAIETSFTTMQDTVATPHSDARPKTRPALQSVLETGELSRLSALVVEDDEVNARIARHLLEKRGWAVSLAGDGREAVDRMRSSRYDLVFLDWHTPRLDGLSAAREIRAQEAPGQRTPLVALTAIATDGAREQCLDAGMDDFLTKPIVQTDLERVLARVVAGAYARNASPKGETSSGGIDFSVLESLTLTTGMGSEMVAELGRIFADTAPKRMLDLRAALAAADGAAAHLAAHSLRGMCAQMGASALAKRFVDLEQSAKAGAIYAMVRQLDSIEGDLENLIAELGAWMRRNEQATPVARKAAMR